MAVTPLDIIEAAAQKLNYDMRHDPKGLWKTDPDKYVKEVIANPRTYNNLFYQYGMELAPGESSPWLRDLQGKDPLVWLDDEQKKLFETLNAIPASDVFKMVSEESLIKAADDLTQGVKDFYAIIRGQVTEDVRERKPGIRGSHTPVRYSMIEPTWRFAGEDEVYKFTNNRFIVFEDRVLAIAFPANKELAGDSALKIYFPEGYQERYNNIVELEKPFEEKSQEVLNKINKYHKKHGKEIDGSLEKKENNIRDFYSNPERIWKETFEKEFKGFDPKVINDNLELKDRENYYYPHELLEFMYRLDKSIFKVNKALREGDEERLKVPIIMEKIQPDGNNQEFNDNFDKLDDKSKELYRKGYDYLIKEVQPNTTYTEFRVEFNKLFQAMLFKMKEEGIEINGEKKKIKIEHIFEKQLPEYYDIMQDEEIRSNCPCRYNIDKIKELLEDTKMFEGVMAPEQLDELNRLADNFSSSIKKLYSEDTSRDIQSIKAPKRGMDFC